MFIVSLITVSYTHLDVYKRQEFNLTVVYGADVEIATVINAAKRYPMMSERQVDVYKRQGECHPSGTCPAR